MSWFFGSSRFGRSELSNIIHQPNLLARLERRQPDVWTSITPESIAQRAVAARSRLPLHREVQLVKIGGVKLEGTEVFIGLSAARGILRLDLLSETAAAVLAGTAALAGLGLAFWGCDVDILG